MITLFDENFRDELFRELIYSTSRYYFNFEMNIVYNFTIGTVAAFKCIMYFSAENYNILILF